MNTLVILFAVLGAEAPASVPFATSEVTLPGARGFVLLDYLAADRNAGRIWIPAGNTGCVDVLEVATRKVSCVAGFSVSPRDARGKSRPSGPSAVSLGDGIAFIGNRATSEICPVDTATLARLPCLSLSVAIDGVQYVAAAKQVWVTTPHDRSLTVLAVGKGGRLQVFGLVPLGGQPEGYAVDDRRKRFFTNLEDQDRTLVIDVGSRKIMHSWDAHCGPSGPRGLAYDPERQFLFVACTEHVEVIDAGHDGAVLGTLDTGAGVDNIDYLDAKRTLYAAAGRAARLTVARVSDTGKLTVLATAPTVAGARVVVVAADGTAVVGDGSHGRVMLLSPRP